jgi:hypothetical protein
MHDFTSVMLGQGLRVKCEAEQSGRLKIFQIENREVNQPWDIFVEHYCIIDHVNRDKQLVHFIVDKKLNGIIPFAILPKNVEVGDTLAIKVSEYIVKNEVRHRVLNCNPSNRAANENVFKTFSEEIRVSNGLGFSTTDIFIDRGLINKYNIQDEDVVTGNAVLNYNKKRSQWGWKAILISM